MKKKIKRLKALEITSFVTSLDHESRLTKRILGGVVVTTTSHTGIQTTCHSNSNSDDIYSGDCFS